jgi:hypothetical protein
MVKIKILCGEKKLFNLNDINKLSIIEQWLLVYLNAITDEYKDKYIDGYGIGCLDGRKRLAINILEEIFGWKSETKINSYVEKNKDKLERYWELEKLNSFERKRNCSI